MSVFRIANPGRQSVGHLLSHKEPHHSSTGGFLPLLAAFALPGVLVQYHPGDTACPREPSGGLEEVQPLCLHWLSDSATATGSHPKPRCGTVLSFGVGLLYLVCQCSLCLRAQLPAWQFLVTAGLSPVLLHRPPDLCPLRETFKKSGSQQVLPGPCRPSLGSCCPWLPLPCTIEGQVSIPVLIKRVEEALLPGGKSGQVQFREGGDSAGSVTGTVFHSCS